MGRGIPTYFIAQLYLWNTRVPTLTLAVGSLRRECSNVSQRALSVTYLMWESRRVIRVLNEKSVVEVGHQRGMNEKKRMGNAHSKSYTGDSHWSD